MSQGMIQGSMREAPLPDIIQLVSQGGKSGCFHVQQEASKARIYLKEGRIIHAVTHAGEGFEALMEVALWIEGSYRFEELVPDVPVTITKPNTSILMEFGRRMDEWRVISQKIPSVDLYPSSTLLPGERPQGVNPREAKVLDLATGYYSLTELAELAQKPVLTVAKDIYGLVMAGHVVMKGIRSGKPPKVEPPVHPPLPAADPVPMPALSGGSPRDLVPVSAMFGGPLDPPPVQAGFPIKDATTASVPILPQPTPFPTQGFPVSEERHQEASGPGFASAFSSVEAPAPKPAAAPADDPQRMVKLMNFTQRIAQGAKTVLPEAQHDLVNRLQAKATQQIISGEGPEAVKGLALAISRGAVDAGCDADLVRNLNAHLKSLFTVK